MDEEGARDLRSKDLKVSSFIKNLNEVFEIEKLVLFGSRARGDNLVGSDYDFIVVSRAFEGVPFIKRMFMVAEMWNHKESLEAFCYTPEELAKKSMEIGIVSEALREGIEINV
jgi:predicted nucleotidyltransferase